MNILTLVMLLFSSQPGGGTFDFSPNQMNINGTLFTVNNENVYVDSLVCYKSLSDALGRKGKKEGKNSEYLKVTFKEFGLVLHGDIYNRKNNRNPSVSSLEFDFDGWYPNRKIILNGLVLDSNKTFDDFLLEENLKSILTETSLEREYPTKKYIYFKYQNLYYGVIEFGNDSGDSIAKFQIFWTLN